MIEKVVFMNMSADHNGRWNNCKNTIKSPVYVYQATGAMKAFQNYRTAINE
ncbi:MAG: hypothetical protein Q4E78_01500 [Eubacteriales bacterium]|nr:hypothetical protein [Eubacteriales bacterium]